jgi:hypothetical protein
MTTAYFVKQDSIVRRIWGKSDTILFIFAGAAAEFALNKAVDWLYFTGRLPADPIGRLFSTVAYAGRIVFSPMEEANKTISTIRQIHATVEQNRGSQIPAWAYRDVLYMLIYYSIASFELLERKLNDEEKEEVYNVFYRVGTGMGLENLPLSFREWLSVREAHLVNDLEQSDYSRDLFRQYKKHLGAIRYRLLVEAQKLVVPERVSHLLHFKALSLLAPAVPFYKFSRWIGADGMIKKMLLPPAYMRQIEALDVHVVKK